MLEKALRADALERVETIRRKIPVGGLFTEKTWRISPEAFPLSSVQIATLHKLGDVLHRFNRACNLLYRQSIRGKQPPWIADLVDRGKSPELIELSRADEIGQHVAAVIRPDLIVTETGFALCEIDTIPGGIGLTAWLAESYADLGEPVLGGADGMRRGFESIFPKGDVVISEESTGYEGEFLYLVGKDRVKRAETYRPNEEPIYRFFESFDWEKLRRGEEGWARPNRNMTPPIKPYLEEKLWLALFWLRPLLPFWRRELSDKGVELLRKVIPYTWIMDSTPLPPHGILPGLGIQNWKEMGRLSQSQRELILKISGFSPLAWGSRGVHVGSDLAAGEWQRRIDSALEQFPHHPYILQRFEKGRLYEHSYVEEGGELRRMKGRIRLCPYYFVTNEKPKLGGVLTTICPADKKLVHGMRDAILVPAKESSG